MRRVFEVSGLLAVILVALSLSVQAVERGLDEASIRECTSPPTKLRVVPAEKIPAGKQPCEVIHTGPPSFCVTDWIQGPREYYGSYQDPLEAGCIDPYPFQVVEIHFWVCASQPCITEIYVDIMEANLEDPTCPVPGQSIFTSDFFILELPAPGNYQVVVPVMEKVCVEAPYFAGFCFPEAVEGLGPITDDTPDGCGSYIWFDVDPWDLVTEVGFPGNILLYSIGLVASENSCDEFPAPLPVIVEPRDTAWYQPTYFSDSVEISVVDTSEGSRIDYVTFEYMDPSGIWYPIGTDYDGTDMWYNTWDTSEVGGDGWSYIWGADGLEEDYYLIRATMTDSAGWSGSDTVTIYYDPLPPVPTIIQPESTGVYCSPIEVLFTLEADHIAEIEGMVCKLSEGWYGSVKNGDTTYNKGIPPMHQDSLYKWGKNDKGKVVNSGCAPTAAAACLKWWGAHGYPGITGGLSDKDLVNSLAGKSYLKTDPAKGTTNANLINGLNQWIWDTLGQCYFQNVRKEKPKNWQKFFKLYAKELKKEDIIISWVSKDGKQKHATTGNSVTPQSMTYDVMDPGTGTVGTYSWPWGSGSGNSQYYIYRMLILSPKPQPPPCPPTPGPVLYSENTYRILWTPDTTQTPYNQWYSMHVTVTDSLGHVGEDLFFFELADYVCGDANADGITDVGDVVYDVNYLFRHGEPPQPMEAGDANCDGIVNVGDVVYLVSYLYKEGPLPGCF